MFRIKPQTVLIIALSIAIIVPAATFGWYYYHVQNGLQYTGDPQYDPNGYQTLWIVGTSSNNVTSTMAHSTNAYPTSNMTIPFSIQARQMNSYLTILPMRPLALAEYLRTKTTTNMHSTSSDEHVRNQHRLLFTEHWKAHYTRILQRPVPRIQQRSLRERQHLNTHPNDCQVSCPGWGLLHCHH